MSLGAEEMDEFEDHTLGDYLMFSDGQYVLLRGKYRGTPLDKVPRGYVREYILNAWKESLSEEEQQLFEQRIKKGLDEATGGGAEGNR